MVPPTVYVEMATLLEDPAPLVAPLLDEPAAALVAPLLLESATVLVAPVLLESATALVAPVLLESATVLVAPVLLESATVLVAPVLLESTRVLVALPLEDPPVPLVAALLARLVAPLDGPPDDEGRRLLLIPALAAEEDPTSPLEELDDDELSSVGLGPQPTAREAARATTVSDGCFKRVRVFMSTSNKCPVRVLPQQERPETGGVWFGCRSSIRGKGHVNDEKSPPVVHCSMHSRWRSAVHGAGRAGTSGAKKVKSVASRVP
jgi:hypothetical protein